MLKLKSKIILSTIAIFSIITFNSCTNEENTVIDENQVISDTNFELLKVNALNAYNNNDFSRVVKPSVNSVNYTGIIETLENTQNRNANSTITNFEDYQDILGDYYDEEYFNQLLELYEYSETLVQSELFNENSTIEERESYLIEVLEYVILEDLESSFSNRSSNCGRHRTVCQNGAERTLGISIAGCTGLAVVAGIFTGGVGAASWPVCMGTAGFHYDSNMQTCQDHYEVCMDQ
jgi:hypothetical protein